MRALAFIVVSALAFMSIRPVSAQEHTWAIQLVHKGSETPYTEEEANEFAIRNGLQSLGAIGGLDGYFLMGLENDSANPEWLNDKEVQSSETQRLQKRSPQQVENELSMHHHVQWYEYQRIKKRSTRAIALRLAEDEADLGFNLFNDPLYQSQWHLVSFRFYSLMHDQGQDCSHAVLFS